MIHRALFIGKWVVDFLFAEDKYDKSEVVMYLKEAEAPSVIVKDAVKLMDTCLYNCGLTFTNPEKKTAVVLIGPTTSGAEFQDSFVHETYHLAEAIAADIGIDLSREVPAYIAGDAARALSEVVCTFGCRPDSL